MLARLTRRRVEQDDMVVGGRPNRSLNWCQQKGLVVLAAFRFVLQNTGRLGFARSNRHLSGSNTRKCD